MRKSITLLGILMLFYLKANMVHWTLSFNENNILSEPLIRALLQLSPSVYSILFYFIIVLCIISLFNKSNKILKVLTYGLSIIVLSMGFQIAIDLLAFCDYSTFSFVKIYHPISLAAKQSYLMNQIEVCLEYNHPQIYYNREALSFYIDRIIHQLQKTNWGQFQTFSPQEIRQYAATILNSPHSIEGDAISYIGFIISMLVIMPIIFNTFLKYYFILYDVI